MENQAPTSVSIEVYIERIGEGSSVSNFMVGDIKIEDDALGTNEITLSGHDAGSFDVKDGSLYLNDGVTLDYETQASYAVTIEVKDNSISGSSPVTTDYTLYVIDKNEAPTVVVLESLTTTTLEENTDTSTRINVAVIAVTDDALGTNEITLSGEDAGSFEVEDGLLYLKDGVTLNYETQASYAVTIEVKDNNISGSSAVTTDYTLNVTDVDEYDVTKPTDADTAANTVAENAAAGATVGVTATAEDKDGTMNVVTYSLADDVTDNNLFSIDSDTGVVTLQVSLNYEDAMSKKITVTATSEDGSTSTEEFTINVTDVDEYDVTKPTDADTADNTVAENAAAGATVGVTATAEDKDGTMNVVTYSLADDVTDNNLFSIDSDTGVVTLQGSLNYEDATSKKITVTATSEDGSTSTEAFTIIVADVNEAPVITSGSTGSVEENADITTSIYTATASDEDDGDTITYSLSGEDEGSFSIDKDKGEVTLNPDAEDYEVKVKYSIVVVAEDRDGLSDEKDVTINLTHSIEDTDIGVLDGISIEEFIQPSNYLAKDQISALLNANDSLSDDDKIIILESFDLHFPDENGQPSVKLLTIEPSADSIEINGSDDDNTVLIVDASLLPAETTLNFNNINYAIIIGPAHLEGGAGANIIIADENPQVIVLGEEDDSLNGGAGGDVIGSHGGNDTLIGGEGDDTIFGGDGDDSIIGGTGNDIIYGEYGPENEACDLLSNTDLCDDEAIGDDTIEGGAGNDTIYGGSGTDTVVFSGNLSDYLITFNEESDTYVVKDIRDESPDGTNTVTQVEYFDFSDVADVAVTTFSTDVLEQAVAASSDGSSGDGLGVFLAGIASVVGALFVI